MSYSYILDGVAMTGIVNDMEITTTIKRNSNMDGFLIFADANLTFTGQAYDYIRGQFFDNGYCQLITIQIIDNCSSGEVVTVYNGIIKQSGTSIDLHECTATVKLEDSGFYSYINNNKSMKVSPTQTGTKSGEISDPPDVYDVEFFDTATGLPLATPVKCYRAYDLFRHCIDVITDNRLGFVSDFLWNVDEELFVTTGLAMRTPGTLPVFSYSFDEIYREFSKQFNLSFFIEEDLYATPTVRIEPKSYFFGQSEGITIENIRDLKVTTDESKIYGTVTLGSETLTESQGLYTFLDTTPFYGFSSERFYPIGQCNLDTNLELVNQWIISDNVIQDVVLGGNSGYDAEIFLVSCENVNTGALTANAIEYDLDNSGLPYQYNLNLNNVNKSSRYYGYLPGDLQDFFNISSNRFKASKGNGEMYSVGSLPGETPLNYISGTGYFFRLCTPPTAPVCTPYPFTNETDAGNYDLGGNYDNSTFIYTAPSTERYTFNVKAFIDVMNAHSSIQDSACYIIFSHYDSTLSTLKNQTQAATPLPIFTGGSEVATASAAFDMVAGDKVFASLDFVVESNTNISGNQNLYRFWVRGTSYFECTNDNVIASSSPVNYKIIQYSLSCPLSQADFRTLKADPTGIQSITKWSDTQRKFITYRGWIDEIKYNNRDSFAQIKLLTNNALIQESV